jgi:hypothetical protein
MITANREITDEDATEAAASVQAAIDLFPDLTDFGFGVFDAYRLTPTQRQEQFRKSRADMFARRSLEDFVRAKRWLSAQTKTKNINSGAGSSYYLKHVAEEDIGYTTNGIFIAAAAAAGFTVERCRRRDDESPNAFFNISSKIIRDIR